MRTRVLAVLAAAALLLSACSVRLETPPVITPTPSNDTLLRDEAAAAEQALIDGIASDPEGCDNVLGAGVAALAAQLSRERLAALGGVYVPFPSASPSPSDSATPPLENCAVLATEAGDTAADGASEATDPDLAALLGSIAISHAMLGRVGEDPRWTHNPSETALDLDPAAAAELAVEHDAARFAYETLAATVEVDARAILLERRDVHAAAVTALIAQEGVADQRESVYVVDAESLADPVAASAQIEAAIGTHYLAVFAESTPARSQEALTAAATFLHASRLASGAPVPALPGLDS